jgi:hypothetical protein
MSNQIERRWGILAIAVLMFFVTMVVTNINGAKTSFYYYIWMMVGYYAYKGNLSSIKSMMKIVIFMNMGVLALIIPFMGDTALGYLHSSSKFDLIASVIVMLIPKVALYFYCKSELRTDIDLPEKKSNGNQQNNSLMNAAPMLVSSSSSVDRDKLIESPDNNKLEHVSMEDAYSQSPDAATKNNKIQTNTKKYMSMEDAYSNEIPQQNTPKPKLIFNLVEQNREDDPEAIDQDDVWSLAYEEFESDNRKIGLWARLFAENNGDEAKSKAAYLKVRSEVIHAHLKEALKETHKTKYESNKDVHFDKTEEECITEKIYDLYEGSGYQIYVFPNGKAAFKLFKIYKIFENKELAITAVGEYRNNGSMGRVGFIREFIT